MIGPVLVTVRHRLAGAVQAADGRGPGVDPRVAGLPGLCLYRPVGAGHLLSLCLGGAAVGIWMFGKLL